MKSEDNFFELFWANITSRIFNLKDAIRNCFLYWRDLQFAKIDLYLTMSYFFKSPYRISREFTKDEEPYGETPLHTMEVIAKAANLSKDDVVYELGFGRGRSCFWLHHFIGCKTVGVEYNHIFVKIAERVKKRYLPDDPNIIFLLEDMKKAQLDEATFAYLYGIALSDESVFEMVEKFKKMKKNSRIVTVSFSLSEYGGAPFFDILREFEVEFPWGKTTAYVHVRK